MIESIVTSASMVMRGTEVMLLLLQRRALRLRGMLGTVVRSRRREAESRRHWAAEIGERRPLSVRGWTVHRLEAGTMTILPRDHRVHQGEGTRLSVDQLRAVPIALALVRQWLGVIGSIRGLLMIGASRGHRLRGMRGSMI